MANPTPHAEGQHHYVAPVSLLAKVLAWLIILTILTSVTGTADWVPGWMHVPLALIIATVKVVLVLLVFMGLRHDNRMNALIFVLGATFVTIFLTFTLFDTVFRGDLTNVDAMTISDRALIEQQDSVRAAQLGNLKVAPGDFAAADADTAVVNAAGAPVAADTAGADTTSAPM